MTNALLVGTWGLTGHGFFWPFFPIAGWGIGLGLHGIVTDHQERRHQEREARKTVLKTQKVLDVAHGGGSKSTRPRGRHARRSHHLGTERSDRSAYGAPS